MDWVKLGKKLRCSRERKGLNQEDIARLVGVSNSLICQLESGKKTVSVNNLIKICRVLDVNLLE